MSKSLSRRAVLSFVGGASAAVIVPKRAAGVWAQPDEKILSLYHLHTRESGKVRFWANGWHDHDGIAEIEYLLRDFRTGEVTSYDTTIFHLLHTLREDLDSHGRFEVISGFRSPKTNAHLISRGRGVSAQSYHMLGMAIDIRLPGRDTYHLRTAARTRRVGGVGYYPKYNFVHLDTGPVRKWDAYPRRKKNPTTPW